MDGQIPLIIEDLYRYFVTEPNPKFGPDHISDDPVKAHGLWAFYQGVRLGMQMSAASLELL